MRKQILACSLMVFATIGCMSTPARKFSSITYSDWNTYSSRDQISIVKEYRKLHGMDVTISSREVVTLLNEMSDKCIDPVCVEEYMNKSMEEMLSGLTMMPVLGAE